MFEPKPTQGFNPALAAADRMTKVLPTDLRQQQFTVAFRGYDRAEVAAFLAEVAEDYEHALREVDRLQQDVRRMEVLLEEYREHERHLRNALLAAQKLSDGIKETAEQEGRRIVNEAEGRSEYLVQQAQSRLEGIRREIDEMRFKRQDAEVSLESAISGLRRSLDLIREQERRDGDDPTTSGGNGGSNL